MTLAKAKQQTSSSTKLVSECPIPKPKEGLALCWLDMGSYTERELDRLRRSSVTGEPLFSIEKMRTLLESAHNPPEDRTGRRPSEGEVADLDAAIESLFFQLPIERQVDYLSSASTEEVLSKLNLMPLEDRDDILEMLPSRQRASIRNLLGMSA